MELLNLRLSKLARAKVLLQLEFDTKDQVVVTLCAPTLCFHKFYLNVGPT